MDLAGHRERVRRFRRRSLRRMSLQAAVAGVGAGGAALLVVLGRWPLGVVVAIAVVVPLVATLESAVDWVRIANLRHWPDYHLNRPFAGPLPPVPPIPAGDGGQPPLRVELLDRRAWGILCWRQERLPLHRVKRSSDWWALMRLEDRAVWKLVDRLGLDDDQRYSLVDHHRDAVTVLAGAAHPDLLERAYLPVVDQVWIRPSPMPMPVRPRHVRWRWLVPNVMVGWPTWFVARWQELCDVLTDARFWLVTRSAYRHPPSPHLDAPS